MITKLSIGLLGTGFASVHAQHLLQLEDVVVSAVCGTTKTKAQAFIQKVGAKEASAFGDFDEMLAKCQLDALYICIPPHAHCGQVEQAAKRGIHLFLEKPIALDLTRAESQVEAIEKAGVVSQVGYHNRYRQSVEVFQGLIASGETGKPTQFQGRYWCNMLGPSWWRDRSKSKGQVFEQVIHIYDMALNLLGEPQAVCAFTDNLVHRDIPDYSIEDTSAAIIRFKNGALASIVGSNSAIPGHYLGDFRIVCEHAVFDFRSSGQEGISPPAATIYTYKGEKVAREEFSETRDPYLAETLDFLATIRGERKSRAPIQTGLKGVRLVCAVLESARKGGQLVAV